MTFEIDSAFPGGNIAVERIDEDEVYVHQELRDTAVDWFYWCFQVSGAAGRTLHFHFTQSRAIGVRGPAVSFDEGVTWTWVGSGAVQGNAFSYTFPKDAAKVRMSFAMPYQESHWLHFIGSLSSGTPFSCRTLCTTKKGRDIEYMLIGNEKPLHRVAITCRHHCCEMMANYVLEGLIRWVAEDPDAEAQRVRDHVGFFLVPFVDKDGVEDGDQGKGRRPRDHGRDYEGESIYASTGAIRQIIPEWGGGLLHIGLDIHCPHITGPYNEVIYIVGSADDRIASKQRQFCRILESVSDGPLPFLAEDFLEFGKSWNTDENYSEGRAFSRWAGGLPDAVLGISIEIPYANARGAEVNQGSARLFGADLGRGLAAYLHRIDEIGITGKNNKISS